ncbi:putative RNA-directed DNA polymerase from transposon X-element [Trichonephila clavipes]|nr:putative RNA-directed DNA polymerase from transposon X-element [Trichonephila clavipes]
MVVGTRVRDLVDGYPPTAENYDKCIDSLRMRFGSKELLIEFYVRELQSLVIKNVTNSRTGSGITQLHDQLQSNLRSLESIGRTSDKYAAMLLPLVESCIGSGRRTKSFVGKIWFEIRCISRNKTEQSHQNDDVNTLPTSAALVSTVDRKSVLIKSEAYFKCVEEKLSARSCRKKNVRCGFCNDKWYHILLCPKKELNKVDIEKAVSNTLSHQIQGNSYVYLQTIALKVSGGNRELVMRCLLHSGSENSYIAQRAISQLSLRSVGK